MKVSGINTRLLVTFFSFLISIPIFAQEDGNLVSNNSFESKEYCPQGFTKSTDKFPITSWYSPNRATPDLYSTCNYLELAASGSFASYLKAEDGKNFAGLILGGPNGVSYREYLSTKLKEKLRVGVSYNVVFYLRVAPKSKFSVDSISIVFTNDSLKYTDDKAIKLSDAIFISISNASNRQLNGWEKIQFQYEAVGNECFFSIGNFSMPELLFTSMYEGPLKEPAFGGTAYYYFDNFSITEHNYSFTK
jgi:hypothetical protein